MLRFITPIILIGISVAVFFMYTNPILSDISTIKNEVASYNQALDNAKSLENERDKLTQKYNAIDPNNLSKLEKFLPDNVDNIRLTLEIEKIAAPYGMVLKDVRYDSISTKKDNTLKTEAAPADATSPAVNNKEYGEWTLDFSTEGVYSKFIEFTKDLESNLRMVDISSVVFSSNTGGIVLGDKNMSDSYTYSFKIKTYWLRN